MSIHHQTQHDVQRSDEASPDANHAAARLRRVLRLNAGFSLVTGTAALVTGGAVADLLGVEPAWVVRAVGVSLLGFAAVVAGVTFASTSVLRRATVAISAADLAWVAATPVVIVVGGLSATGAIVMAVVALAVLDFAIAQVRAVRHLERTTA